MSYDIVIRIHRNTVASNISLAKMVLDRACRNSTTYECRCEQQHLWREYKVTLAGEV